MHGEVIDTAWLTPHLVRVVLGGSGLDGFVMPEHTDAYVNVAIPPAGARYGGVFDVADVRDRLPEQEWPLRRRYTVRRWNPGDRLLTIDFVVHGDHGVAGPWAAGARPGDVLVFTGPNGAYRPAPDADWHLLVGDESALPAIAASVEVLPADARAIVRLLCDGPAHELQVTSPAQVDVRWLHRTGAPDESDLLAAAVRDLQAPAGRVHAFVHGEAEEVRAVRRHLLADRGMPRADLSASPYWRRDMTDEAWRRIKGDWAAEVERDVA